MIKRKVKNSIEFSDGKGYLILKTNKKDLDFINDIYGLNNSPATYMVIGDYFDQEKRCLNYYVGESSVNVISRLNESFQKRKWINEIYIIISPNKLLTMEIVKTLEFMILQTIKNTFSSNEIEILNDNADCGVIGYRSQFGVNPYTLLINDIFQLFFNDVICYSKYSSFFNYFEIEPLMTKTCKICFDRMKNICSSLIVKDSLLIIKNSLLRINNETLENSPQSIKILFRSLLDLKCIFPIIIEDNICWCFNNDVKLPISNLNDFIKLSCNSLNANLANNTMTYSRFIKKQKD